MKDRTENRTEPTIRGAGAAARMQKFYDANIREFADQLPDPEREQIQAAFQQPPANPDDVDPWFLKHFHAAPVAHDTALFNRLSGMKAAIRDVAGSTD